MWMVTGMVQGRRAGALGLGVLSSPLTGGGALHRSVLLFLTHSSFLDIKVL